MAPSLSHPPVVRSALITGITGQDGSYLAEYLLSKGYMVHGLVRRHSATTPQRIDPFRSRLTLHGGDLTDAGRVREVVAKVRPTEIYNLAAQSHVGVSFEQPDYTVAVNGQGCLHLLEAIRQENLSTRYYQASTSEMFGNSTAERQNELTPLHPRSPYAAAKVLAHQLTGLYRDAYGIHASAGVLFNHESERRGIDFVTRKITLAVGRIVAGKQDTVALGNTEARRDWGYAPDYVDAMWRMTQQDDPADYVVATGETHSVQEFVEAAFAVAGLDWKNHVVQDERFMRPSDVASLCGDSSLAQAKLGWKPTHRFEQLVERMVEHDIRLAGE